MSLYPILWAAEHAPVADAEERAILVALVMKSDADGRNCFRSQPTLARLARVDPKTVSRRLKAMEQRGLIRRQPGRKPQAWHKIPKDKRPVVWEVLIPASFWSTRQLDDINEHRTTCGLPPITPENRPDLPEAPPKKQRADKGVKRPERQKKTSSQDWDAPQTPREIEERGDYKSPRENETGGTTSPVAGGLQVRSRGDSQSPNPPSNPPRTPSSPPAPPVTAEGSRLGRNPAGKEDESANEDQGHEVRARAEGLVRDALRRWHSAHAAPNAATRRRLVQRVAAELADGADAEAVLRELTRDLHPSQAASAVRVVMARTKTPGWGRVEDPRPAADRHVPAGPRPPWCGRCDERTRLLVAVYEDARGEVREQMARCRDCHPDADVALDGAQMAADGPEAAVGAVPEPPPLEELVADLDAHRRRTEGGGQGRGQRVGLPPVVADVRQVLAEIQQRSRTTM